MPEEMIGVVPNSIKVPLLLANIIRSQYIGSEVSELTMPYNGIWLITKNMSKVNYRSISICCFFIESLLLTPVHINFWLNGIFVVSGAATSGSRGYNSCQHDN